MRNRLKLILISFRNGLHNEMVFRSDFFMGIVRIVLRALLLFALWQALYEGKTRIDGITLETMVFYALASIVFEILISSKIEGTISGDINSGNISMMFARPLKYPETLLLGQVSTTGVNMILRVLPYSLILIVIYFTMNPAVVISVPLILSALLSYVLFSLYQMFFGLISFWTMEITGIIEARDAAMLVFSGSMIPLWFFPDWLFRLAEYLPFQAMFHTPLSIMIRKLEGRSAWEAITVQALWLLVFSVLVYLVWIKAKRRVVVNAG